MKKDHSRASNLQDKIVAALPTVQSIVTWIGICAITVHAIYDEDYSDAWLILCAILVMDSVRNFFQFVQGQGIIQLGPSLTELAQTFIWLAGIILIWAVAKATLPNAITGDFRIMALVLTALVAISLINWACQFNPSKEGKNGG